MARVSDEVGDWERYLAAPLTGRKVICAFEVLASMTRLVSAFERWGAEPPLLLADGIGTGPLPLETDCEIVLIESSAAPTLTEQVRLRMRAAERLTPDLVAAIDAYDPTGDAVWWVGPPVPNTPMLGRPVLGGRPQAQARLEDKLLLDELLASAGAPVADAVITRAELDELRSATRAVRDQSGSAAVVWAGDSRDGINGGGDYVRWIGDDEQAATAAEYFSSRCDRVRVSPYYEGVPCSIHALVLPDGVVVLRPVELASILDPSTGVFFYGGLGTAWDPPPDDREAMRALARRLGESLRTSVGYRGAFGIDGVLTRDGFVATEFNPRFSGGLTRLNRGAPEAQLELVQLNSVIGRDVGRPAAEIEAAALAALDQDRFVDALAMTTSQQPDDSVQLSVAISASKLVEATDETSEPIGSIVYGPATQGAFIRLSLDERAVEPGLRTAGMTRLLVDFSNEHWQTDLPVLDIPPSVR